ncbi:hypothetical protein BC835DRAFT_1304485 [Cytidiella melzeri]|nr:hypothetical protein BC835DRAFT_1304485 [Cytidiella melzeri]
MHRKMGAEAWMPGLITKESQQNLDTAEKLCRAQRPAEALPYLEKAMEDPRNLDAWIQLAFLAPDLTKSTGILVNAERQGKRLLKQEFGQRCFDEHPDPMISRVGQFWSLLQTRPYMRTLQALVRIHQENKRFDLAAKVGIEMLRLCPNDNMSVREGLGTCLLKANRDADALSFAQAWIHREDGTSPPKGGCAFTPPSSAPLTKAQLDKLSSCVEGAIAYTAALASFRLYGDTKLARQYLIYAASVNHNVLLKVLGRVAQPKSLVSTPRQPNSTEAAHDYLWKAQDLWMEEKVWNWADGVPEVKAHVLKECSRAGCSVRERKVAQFKRCGSCHKAWYCGTACQKEHWKTHKTECQQHTAYKKMYRMITTKETNTGMLDEFLQGASVDMSQSI